MEWTTQGRTVLITGAARGLGAETARRLAARGANVALVGLEPDELQRVAAQCGTNAAWFECDVTDVEALERAVQGTVERFGGIDVVMANAGIATGGTVRATDPAAFERTIEINLLGVWRTVRACLPHVVERQGYVLVIASLAAAVHGPGMAAYSASKAGAEAFADSLRSEVRHLGVDVGVGYFSFIDTDMVRGGDEHPVARRPACAGGLAGQQDLPALVRRPGDRRRHRAAAALDRLPGLGARAAGAADRAGAAARARGARHGRRGRRAVRQGRRGARRSRRVGPGRARRAGRHPRAGAGGGLALLAVVSVAVVLVL